MQGGKTGGMLGVVGSVPGPERMEKSSSGGRTGRYAVERPEGRIDNDHILHEDKREVVTSVRRLEERGRGTHCC